MASMRTNILYSFVMTQNMRQLKLRKRKRIKSTYAQSFQVLPCRLLKIVSDTVWDIYLLEMSIFETKTALTTLNCLSRKYIRRKHIDHSLFNNVKERLVKNAAVKEISSNLHFLLLCLFRGLKRFLYALNDHLE